MFPALSRARKYSVVCPWFEYWNGPVYVVQVALSVLYSVAAMPLPLRSCVVSVIVTGATIPPFWPFTTPLIVSVVFGPWKSIVLSPLGIWTVPMSTMGIPGPPLIFRCAVVAGPALLIASFRLAFSVCILIACDGAMPRLLNSIQRCFSAPEIVHVTALATVPAASGSEISLLAVVL